MDQVGCDNQPNKSRIERGRRAKLKPNNLLNCKHLRRPSRSSKSTFPSPTRSWRRKLQVNLSRWPWRCRLKSNSKLRTWSKRGSRTSRSRCKSSQLLRRRLMSRKRSSMLSSSRCNIKKLWQKHSSRESINRMRLASARMYHNQTLSILSNLTTLWTSVKPAVQYSKTWWWPKWLIRSLRPARHPPRRLFNCRIMLTLILHTKASRGRRHLLDYIAGMERTRNQGTAIRWRGLWNLLPNMATVCSKSP